ncbi:paraquat-inducible protein A [Frigidibacter sp. MR17.24]|uniref:paraquat-inducible protein A n=1 Tax=Frigidibacter sp. MR17.24 TaxID=3127345 RepID=UPI003012DFA9
MDDSDLARLRACPHCDALYRLPELAPRERADCARCGATLIAPQVRAFSRSFALAITALILMAGAVFGPFLDLSTAGMQSRASVLDAIEAFSDGVMFPLSLAVGALIVVIPALRLALIAYTLGPMLRGGAPWPRAGQAFRLAEQLKPWSMAEIFLIGVAVALVKVAGLATVHPGIAFWALCLLVLVTVLQDTSMDKETVWHAIETRRGKPDGSFGAAERPTAATPAMAKRA